MKQIDERGQVLIFVTLAFIILGLFIGLAIDGGRAYLARAELARKVDPAALAAAANLAAGFPAAQEAACNSVKMNGLDCSDITVTQETITLPSGGTADAVRVSAANLMPTSFMALGALIGCGDLCRQFTVRADAVAVPGNNFDLVMNLDNTGSMSGSKIRNAKIGANALVDAAIPADSSASLALVGMVPFQGCYNSSGSDDCIDSDEFPNNGGDIVSLTNENPRLHNGINALDAPGGSGTNVCNGLKRARQKLFQSGVSRPKALKFLILLTDAENNYQTGLPAGSVDSACIPTGSNADQRNRDLGVKTNNLATQIKNPTSSEDGQQPGQTVTIFVIMYGSNATEPVPDDCDPSDLSSGNPTSRSYTKNLARCVASSAGDVYLAPDPSDISDAFFQIISRLPVRLVN